MINYCYLLMRGKNNKKRLGLPVMIIKNGLSRSVKSYFGKKSRATTMCQPCYTIHKTILLLFYNGVAK